jgi:hypothetical protein
METASNKETEAKAWRLEPDEVETWEMVKLGPGEMEAPLDSVISSFRNEADDHERR